MIARVPKRRNVKSGPGQGVTGAADGHERAKDFLTAAELVACWKWPRAIGMPRATTCCS